VYFVKDENGRTQILDAVAPVFEVDVPESKCRRATGVYVSHFATCPDASSWSTRGR
jgi:hypothetical protein